MYLFSLLYKLATASNLGKTPTWLPLTRAGFPYVDGITLDKKIVLWKLCRHSFHRILLELLFCEKLSPADYWSMISVEGWYTFPLETSQNLILLGISEGIPCGTSRKLKWLVRKSPGTKPHFLLRENLKFEKNLLFKAVLSVRDFP